VVAVVFLYQITDFLQQNTTASLLELYFNDSMQTAAAAVAVNKERSPMGPMGRCSIYRHRPCLSFFLSPTYGQTSTS